MSYGRSKIKLLHEIKPEDWAEYGVEPTVIPSIEPTVKFEQLTLKYVNDLEPGDYQLNSIKFVSMVEQIRESQKVNITLAYEKVAKTLKDAGYQSPYKNLFSYNARSPALKNFVNEPFCSLRIETKDLQLTSECFSVMVYYQMDVKNLESEDAYDKVVEDLDRLGRNYPFNSYANWINSKTRRRVLRALELNQLHVVRRPRALRVMKNNIGF